MSLAASSKKEKPEIGERVAIYRKESNDVV